MIKEQWALLTAVITGFLASTIFGFLKSYIGTRGKDLATKHDLVEIQNQLKENTAITKSIERAYSRDDFLWRSELAYRERQLSELYGPAYGYVQSQNEIYDLWIEGKMQEANLPVKQLLARQNQILRDLIIDKVHLIEGSSMPACFVRFFTSTLVFDLYAAPTEIGEVPSHLRVDPRTIYPGEFNDHITSTAEQLKTRIETLNAHYAPPLQPQPAGS